MALWSTRLGRQCRPVLSSSRCIPRRFFTAAASHPANKTQVYISSSRDAFLNLSIEHHLLQNTPPDSTILLLYTNSPSIVFGRNQNPWMEVNLPRLAQLKNRPESLGWKDGPVRLVRRRSGGGTVFHDEGNVNFSVICPPAVFDRNKHAEMVVRALEGLGRPNTRVNERHDIVLDADDGTFKISGSAYKLTRLRSLHHGTCLLQSPNLKNISGMLRSPAEAFIKTRGVDSVRSPVRNVEVDRSAFEEAVVDEFSKMYGSFDVKETVSDKALAVESVKKGYEELKSRDWIYGQTPRFTFSTVAYEDDARERPTLPFEAGLRFESRHGIIDKFSVEAAPFAASGTDMSALAQTSLYDVPDWSVRLVEAGMKETRAEKGECETEVLELLEKDINGVYICYYCNKFHSDVRIFDLFTEPRESYPCFYLYAYEKKGRHFLNFNVCRVFMNRHFYGGSQPGSPWKHRVFRNLLERANLEQGMAGTTSVLEPRIRVLVINDELFLRKTWSIIHQRGAPEKDELFLRKTGSNKDQPEAPKTLREFVKENPGVLAICNHLNEFNIPHIQQAIEHPNGLVNHEGCVGSCPICLTDYRFSIKFQEEHSWAMDFLIYHRLGSCRSPRSVMRIWDRADTDNDNNNNNNNNNTGAEAIGVLQNDTEPYDPERVELYDPERVELPWDSRTGWHHTWGMTGSVLGDGVSGSNPD
ncbi:Fc.00g009090.m01.CDS01 [Cosmosporella sp. VM-42]